MLLLQLEFMFVTSLGYDVLSSFVVSKVEKIIVPVPVPAVVTFTSNGILTKPLAKLDVKGTL